MFSLYGTPDLGLMLKSCKAQTVNGKSTVTIICETTDHTMLSWSLRQLDATAAEQKKAAAAARASARASAKAAAHPAKKTKPTPKAPLLALPAPLLALPKPEGK